MGSIVVAGQSYSLIGPISGNAIPVRAWNDGQLPKVPEFHPGDGYNKKRLKPIDLAVWHWTGGEQDPIPMADTLRVRKLGVEWSISRSGTVYQFCDPAVVDTADAATVNARSVGVEIICYGYAWEFTIDPIRAMKVPVVPKLGKDREIYDALTHGRTVKTAQFYPVQLDAALALAEAISRAIPAVGRQVPPAEMNTVYPALAGFKGHVGHYHVSLEKRDPGPWFIEHLRKQFMLQAPVIGRS